MSEALNSNLLGYSTQHRVLFQEERVRLLGELPPIDENFIADEGFRSELESERQGLATTEGLAYAGFGMGESDPTMSNASKSFHEFRFVVYALKHTAVSEECEQSTLPEELRDYRRLNTRQVFGGKGFAQYQELTQTLRVASEAGNGDHRLVYSPLQESPAESQGRWRKCVRWLGEKILRKRMQGADQTQDNPLRQKAELTFETIWQEIGMPDTESNEADEQKLALRTLFDTNINNYTYALNSNNLRHDLIRLSEEKKYRSHTMSADISHRYSLPRREGARLVKEQVQLPAYSPLRLASETLEIARLVQLAEKKRALGTLAIYGCASDAAIGLLPLMAANIIQSGGSAGSVTLAAGISMASWAMRGMLADKSEQLTGDVCESLNNKIADAIFNGNTATIAEFDASRLYNALKEGKQAVEYTIDALINTVMSSVVIMGTAAISLAVESPVAAVTALAGLGPTYFLLSKVAARYYSQREEAIRANNDATKFLQDSTKAVSYMRTITQNESAQADTQAALNHSERVERAARRRYMRNFFFSKVPMGASGLVPAALTGAMDSGTEALASAAVGGPIIAFNVNRFLDYFLEAGDSGQRIEELRKIIESTITEERQVPESHDIRLKNVRIILSRQLTEVKGPRRRLLDLSGSEVEIPEGTFAAFIGPSGSGKSTAVGALAGFLNYHGEVEIGGVPASRVKTNEVITYAPQSAHFNTKQTVLQNLLPGRTPEARAEQRAELTQLLYDLGLERFVDLFDELMPERPSGGEAKRLNLARALSEGSPVIALDEPTSELDKISAGKVYVTLNKYHRHHPNKTIIAITHDDDVSELCDMVVDFGKLSNRHASRFGNSE